MVTIFAHSNKLHFKCDLNRINYLYSFHTCLVFLVNKIFQRPEINDQWLFLKATNLFHFYFKFQNGHTLKSISNEFHTSRKLDWIIFLNQNYIRWMYWILILNTKLTIHNYAYATVIASAYESMWNRTKRLRSRNGALRCAQSLIKRMWRIKKINTQAHTNLYTHNHKPVYHFVHRVFRELFDCSHDHIKFGAFFSSWNISNKIWFKLWMSKEISKMWAVSTRQTCLRSPCSKSLNSCACTAYIAYM